MIDQGAPKQIKKIDVNFSYLSLYMFLFSFFIYLCSISTIHKQKAEQAIQSVKETFNLNAEDNVQINAEEEEGHKEGGSFNQKVQGIFQNYYSPSALYQTNKGEVIEIEVEKKDFLNLESPHILPPKAFLLLEKISYLIKETIDDLPAELTIFLSKKSLQNNQNDTLFFGEKESLTILGVIARTLAKFGLDQKIVSIGLDEKLGEKINFQFRQAPQKPKNDAKQ